MSEADPSSVPPTSVPPTPSNGDSRRAFGFAAIGVATFVWSLGVVLVKWSSLDGLTFAMFRLWAGTSVSVLALLVTRRRLPWATLRACAPGGVFFAVEISLSFSAVNRTSVVDVGVIGALAPVVIAIVSTRLLKERISGRDWLLILASFGGVVIVVADGWGQGAASRFGDLLALLGIVSWTGYWFFSRRVRERFDSLEYFACVMIVGALTLTPVALLLEGAPGVPAARDWMAVFGVAIFPGFVGHTLAIWSHRYVESWRSAMITQLSPVLSALAAWIVLHEAVSPTVAVGGAIVVGASAAVIVSAARREHALEEPVEVPA